MSSNKAVCSAQSAWKMLGLFVSNAVKASKPVIVSLVEVRGEMERGVWKHVVSLFEAAHLSQLLRLAL